MAEFDAEFVGMSAADPEPTSIYFDMFAGIGTTSALYTPKLLNLLAVG